MWLIFFDRSWSAARTCQHPPVETCTCSSQHPASKTQEERTTPKDASRIKDQGHFSQLPPEGKKRRGRPPKQQMDPTGQLKQGPGLLSKSEEKRFGVRGRRGRPPRKPSSNNDVEELKSCLKKAGKKSCKKMKCHYKVTFKF